MTEMSASASIEYLLWTIKKSPASYALLREGLQSLQTTINEAETKYKKENGNGN